MHYRELKLHPKTVEMIRDTLYEWQTLAAALIWPAIEEHEDFDDGGNFLRKIEWQEDQAEWLLSRYLISENPRLIGRFQGMPTYLKRQAAIDAVCFACHHRKIIDAAPHRGETVPPVALISRKLGEYPYLVIYIEEKKNPYIRDFIRYKEHMRMKLYEKYSGKWLWRYVRVLNDVGPNPTRQVGHPMLCIASKGVSITLTSDHGPSLEEILSLTSIIHDKDKI